MQDVSLTLTNGKMMNLVELKEFIDAHHCSDDASWQRVVFDNLFEMFSVIPIASGVYSGNTTEEIADERKVCDLKAAKIPEVGSLLWTSQRQN